MWLQPEEHRNLKIVLVGKTKQEAEDMLARLITQRDLDRDVVIKGKKDDCLMEDGTYYKAISIENVPMIRGIKADQVLFSPMIYDTDIAGKSCVAIREEYDVIECIIYAMTVASILPEEFNDLKIQEWNW